VENDIVMGRRSVCRTSLVRTLGRHYQ